MAEDPQVDWGTAQKTAPDVDWNTVQKPVQRQPSGPQTVKESQTAAQSLVYSRMFNKAPADAYQYHDELQDQMKQIGVGSGPSIAQDIKVGAEGSIFGLMKRNQLPETLQNPGMFDQFVTGLSTMIADLPFYIGGGIVGGAAGSEVPVVGNVAGASIGIFAVPQAIRKALTEGISKGHVQSFGDMIDRVGNVALAGTEGAVTGAVFHGVGLATIPGVNPLVGAALKKAQQVAAMTLLPDLFEGRIPTAQEFAVNAALFTAMHYTAKSMGLADTTNPKVHAKMLEAYSAEAGAHPSEITAEALTRAQTEPDADPIDRLNEIIRGAQERAQASQAPAEGTAEAKEPPVVSEPSPPGLRPAIKVGDEVTPAGEGEQHPDVIDRTEGAAKAEESGNLERGFVDRDDKFHTRDEAKSWVRQNEPEVAKEWEKVTGDPNAPFHSEDYNEARQNSTGIKNAAVDQQRAQAGLPPIESPMRAMDPDNWEVAKEDVDSGRLDPMAIAESINKNPRGLSPEETNALNYQRARLSNDHKTTMDAIEKARAEDNPQAEAAARERLAGVEDKINTVDQATKRAGTEWGLTGLMRQRMVAEDYSLDRMLQRARVASKNGEVAPQVRDRLENLSNKLEAANKKVEELQTRKSAEDAQKTVDRIKEEAKRAERKGTRQQVRVELKVEFDNQLKALDKMLSGRVSSNPFFDPEVLGILGKMAKNRVESGLTRIEDIVDDIHGAMTNIGYDVTKRDLRDAISGYGKTIEMSKEAVAVTLREARRQGKLISALEDAESKRLPLRSGLQRDTASDRVRELQRQVKQAMSEAGIDARKSQTPEAQWRTALESVKTRLRNQITDLNKQIETRTKTPPREGIAYDEEAKALQEHRDQLRDTLRQVTEEPSKSSQFQEQRIKAAEKQLAELQRRVREGDTSTSPDREGPETERMSDLKEQLSATRDTLRQMKEDAKPKTPRDQARMKAAEKQIGELERRIKEGDVTSQAARRQGPLTEQVTQAQNRLDALRETYAEMKKAAKPGRTPAEIAEQKIKTASAAIEKQIAEVERRIKENDLTPAQRRAGRPEVQQVGELRNRLDDLRETYRQMKEAAEPKKSPEEAALARFKTYTQNRIADMQRRIDTGDFAKEPQRKTALDPEATELKLKAERLRQQMNDEIAKQERSNWTPTEKALHYFAKWRRAVLLTGVRTFGKLGAAAMSRMGVTPIEELVGGVLSKVPGISGVAERAPFEGKPSISAEAKAVAEIFNPDTWGDTWHALKTGKTSLDELYGKKGLGQMPPEALDFIGHTHAMVKVIPKRAEFARRMEIGTQWALDHNLDIMDPRVQSALTAGAYQEAQRAIFMQDNVVSDMWKLALNFAHQRGAGGRAIEAIGRFTLPIVKVPTNIVAETLAYHPGSLAWQTFRTIQMLFNEDKMGKSAMDNLSMHDMDNIMRGLKKGTVGIGLLHGWVRSAGQHQRLLQALEGQAV